MREPHFITPTTGNYYPTNVAFFDCETEPRKIGNDRVSHVMKLAVMQHYRFTPKNGWRLQKELVTHSPQDISSFIHNSCRKRSTLYLFAHNIQFDLLVSSLFTEISEMGYALKSFYFKGMVSIFEWQNETRKIIALDSSNFFQGKLADIGETMGIPKMPIDFDNCSMEYLIEYCRNDVLILVRMFMNWLTFLQDMELGAFKRTLASTSFNAWRFKYLRHKVYVHNEPLVLSLEQASYHGGRVEMFKRGLFNEDTYYRLDINAMYPSIMAQESFPVSLYSFKYDLDVKRLLNKLDKYAVIADVEVETNEPAFPVKTEDALIYPTGRFRAVLSTPEIKLLLDCGIIHHVFFAAWYQQQPIFREYMLAMYDLRMQFRKAGNKPYEKMSKILGNSLYGKFGQLSLETIHLDKQKGEQAHVEYRYDVDRKQHYKVVHIAGNVFEQRPGGYSYHAFPAIASHVTAYGRVGIYNLIRKAGRENVFHTDTDGLIVNQVGYDRLLSYINADEMGMLKVEEICEWVEVKAPKHYITPSVVKTKGIRADAQQLHFDLYQQQHFAGLSTMLARGSISEVHVDRVLKSLTFPIRTGVRSEDGSILPFHLD